MTQADSRGVHLKILLSTFIHIKVNRDHPFKTSACPRGGFYFADLYTFNCVFVFFLAAARIHFDGSQNVTFNNPRIFFFLKIR